MAAGLPSTASVVVVALRPQAPATGGVSWQGIPKRRHADHGFRNVSGSAPPCNVTGRQDSQLLALRPAHLVPEAGFRGSADSTASRRRTGVLTAHSQTLRVP